jgi:DASH complex subunit DAD3
MLTLRYQLSSTLATLSSGPITLEVAEGLRLLERKVASVYTLMKASVYSIVLQQGQLDGEMESESMTDPSNRGD